MIHFRCTCGAKLSAPEGSAGSKYRCRSCGQVGIVPQVDQPKPAKPASRLPPPLKRKPTGITVLCAIVIALAGLDALSTLSGLSSYRDTEVATILMAVILPVDALMILFAAFTIKLRAWARTALSTMLRIEIVAAYALWPVTVLMLHNARGLDEELGVLVAAALGAGAIALDLTVLWYLGRPTILRHFRPRLAT